MLARREHSRQELCRKLIARGFHSDTVETVLDVLGEERLQSDERFAEALVDSRVQRGQGPIRIRVELTRRGVADAVIAEHLPWGDEIWSVRAEAARRRRFGEERPLGPQQTAKQVRFLSGRGFTHAQIRSALRASDA